MKRFWLLFILTMSIILVTGCSVGYYTHGPSPYSGASVGVGVAPSIYSPYWGSYYYAPAPYYHHHYYGDYNRGYYNGNRGYYNGGYSHGRRH